MRIFNKEISFFDFLPYACVRVWRRYFLKQPEWKAWQYDTVPVLLYIGSDFNSYSQFGEDIMLSYLFRSKVGQGKYIDVGANHPKILNNTYKFYLDGWRGVNIEPGGKMFELLQSVRNEDTNLQIGLGNRAGCEVFYEMDVDSVSTFNKKEADNGEYGKEIIRKIKIEILTIKDIYDQYFLGETVDFISIDVEGNNLQVLEGNDWQVFRPSYILIEMPEKERLEIIPYLYEHGYYLIFDNSLNGIFADSGVCSPCDRPKTFDQCLMPQKCS